MVPLPSRFSPSTMSMPAHVMPSVSLGSGNAGVTLWTLAPILSFLATINGVKSFLLMAASQKVAVATLVAATPAILPQRCRARANKVFDAELEAIAGVDAVLMDNAQRRCVASSSSPARIRRSLKTTGLYSHFEDDAIFSAVMVKNGKPAPDLFLYAAEAMGVAPAECIVIEDSRAGVQAGVAAGMTVLGCVGASHIRDGHANRLREIGTHHIFDDMSALPGLLGAVVGRN